MSSALKPYLLAFPCPLRDRLVAAVLSGEKVSTTGLHVGWWAPNAPAGWAF